MDFNLELGLSYEFEMTVEPSHAASTFGSGGVDVLATPYLIANMEIASFHAVESKLEEGFTTVGTKVNIEHIAATPIGMKATFKVKLIEINKARLLFEVEAYDEKDKIGSGTHERCIINKEKFMAKTNGKRG